MTISVAGELRLHFRFSFGKYLPPGYRSAKHMSAAVAQLRAQLAALLAPVPSGEEPLATGVAVLDAALAGGIEMAASVGGSYANTSSAVSHIINGVPVNGNTASDTLDVTPVAPAIALLKMFVCVTRNAV